jgi:hypothetical protein
MNSKVKISQIRRGLVCVENKRCTQLAQSQSRPGRSLLDPIYRWPGLENPVGVQYKLHCLYTISSRISTTSMLGPI